MSDPGISAATQRIEDILETDSTYWREWPTLRRGYAEALASAAREDYAETIRATAESAYQSGSYAGLVVSSRDDITPNPHRAKVCTAREAPTFTHTAKPRLLDLCACEGGGSEGYDRAGFHVYVVDMDKNRLKYNRHPSHHGDALEVLRTLLNGDKVRFKNDRTGDVHWLYVDDFAAIHVSPPCQGYTRGNAGKVTNWPKLIPDFRDLLVQTDLPYVIENVTDAAPEMLEPTALCGCMFDLSTIDTDGIRIHLKRERMFETGGWHLAAPRTCNHDGIEWWAGAYGGARRDKYEAKYVRKGGYVPPSKDVVKALLGIEHDMTWNGLFECLPPAYTAHVGRRLIAHLAANQGRAA